MLRDTVWISICTCICAFSVSGISIYLGYKLLIKGITGEFKFKSTFSNLTMDVISASSGIAFALLGMIIAIYALVKLIE